jgi:hypothetical protein
VTVTHDDTLIWLDGGILVSRGRKLTTFTVGDPLDSRHLPSEPARVLLCGNGVVSVAADAFFFRNREGSAGKHAQTTLTWTSTVLQYPIGT